MLRAKKFFPLAAAAMLLMSGAASAETLTFEFTGTVTYGGTLASPGAQVKGLLTYDSETPGIETAPGAASYMIPGPHLISIAVEGRTIVASNLNVSLLDNTGSNVEDIVDIYGSQVLVDGSYYRDGALGFRLASAAGNTRALKGTALPKRFDLHAFDAGPGFNGGNVQSDGGPTGQLLQFSIDRIERARSRQDSRDEK